MAAIVAALVWVAVPLAVGAHLLAEARDEVAAPVHLGTWAPAGAEVSELSTAVVVAGRFGDPVTLVAPAWSGTVTAVHVAAGATVRDGTPIVTIDAVQRIAAHTDRPFYRSLERGSVGPDVTQLQWLLAAQGYDHGTGATFDRATERGVRALSLRLGQPEAVPDFDPAWVVFLPAEEATVASTSVPAGGPAPAAGTPVVALAAPLEGIELLDPGTIVDDTDPTAEPPDDDPGDTAPAPAEVEGSPVGAVPDGASLHLEGAEIGPLPVAADGTIADPTTLVALLAERSSLEATIIAPAAASTRRVPAGALVATATGTTCVVTRAPGGATRTVPVDVGTSADSSESPVASPLPSGPLEVLIDPPLARRRTCG